MSLNGFGKFLEFDKRLEIMHYPRQSTWSSFFFKHKTKIPFEDNINRLTERHEWLDQNIGEYQKAWRCHIESYSVPGIPLHYDHIFHFKTKEDLTMFLLRWS